MAYLCPSTATDADVSCHRSSRTRRAERGGPDRSGTRRALGSPVVTGGIGRGSGVATAGGCPHARSPVVRPDVAQALPSVFSDAAFDVRTLAPRRTFWEKAFLLHEETRRPADKPRRRRLARHYYDLWSLIRKGVGN